MMTTGMVVRRLVLVRREGRGLGITDPVEHVCEVEKMAGSSWGDNSDRRRLRSVEAHGIPQRHCPTVHMRPRNGTR